ncbi:MAG TPA: ergothioneine biosynthesis protein EgtB [Polyangiaceae bacterium]
MLEAAEVASRYVAVRARTEALAAPLSPEDAMVQSMPDASPAKWHLAHTTWFFEEFLLRRWHDARWRPLFNSYYEAAGPRHARAGRGVLSRPTLDEIRAWRAAVDDRVLSMLQRAEPRQLEVAFLGTHHEEQHQELLLTDVQHAFWSSELRPAYRDDEPRSNAGVAPPLRWVAFDEAIVGIGHDRTAREPGFAFDNETHRHRVLVGAFQLASRLVTNGEYDAFVADGGYERPELWLSDGWAAVQQHGWRSPLYWEKDGAAFGLRGVRPRAPNAPVAHVSHYEADAYARWAGARLATEAEWERAAAAQSVRGNFLDEERLATTAAPRDGAGVTQLFGDAWEWTASAYVPYPGFRAFDGALGEYNGKFMSGQMVLRGGSCFSPRDHIRPTYRNFFPPQARWQVSGIRLARDV